MKSEVKIGEKILLSLDESCLLTGIGKNSMKHIIKTHPEISLSYGQITKIKRQRLEEFLLESTHVDNFTTN